VHLGDVCQIVVATMMMPERVRGRVETQLANSEDVEPER